MPRRLYVFPFPVTLSLSLLLVALGVYLLAVVSLGSGWWLDTAWFASLGATGLAVLVFLSGRARALGRTEDPP